jgi:hypothetical protein
LQPRLLAVSRGHRRNPLAGTIRRRAPWVTAILTAVLLEIAPSTSSNLTGGDTTGIAAFAMMACAVEPPIGRPYHRSECRSRRRESESLHLQDCDRVDCFRSAPAIRLVRRENPARPKTPVASSQSTPDHSETLYSVERGIASIISAVNRHSSRQPCPRGQCRGWRECSMPVFTAPKLPPPARTLFRGTHSPQRRVRFWPAYSATPRRGRTPTPTLIGARHLRAARSQPFAPHDLRRMAATLAGDFGFEDAWIAKCLDHAASKTDRAQVTGKVYNHSMKEKRAVLDGVAAELRRIVGKHPVKAPDPKLRLAA